MDERERYTHLRSLQLTGWLPAMFGVVVAAALAVASPLVSRAAPPITGPAISVGAPSLSNGQVRVPIAAGASPAPYSGFSLHLRWDPAVFSFVAATSAGAVFDQGTGNAMCFANTSQFDHDGGGVVFSCSALGSTTVSAPALLATVALKPSGGGCSPLHLTTYGPPDWGDSSSGSFTIEEPANPTPEYNQNTPQTNTYVDGSADVTGRTCQVGPGMPTLDPGIAAAAPTEAPAPTAVASTSGSVSSTEARTPSGGAVTSDTPASSGRSNTSRTIIIMLVVVAVLGIVAGGGAYVFRRRRRA